MVIPEPNLFIFHWFLVKNAMEILSKVRDLNEVLKVAISYLFETRWTLDSDFIPIQSHSKFKIIADTYQMATLSLFEDYSVDSFSKSFLANKLKVDYNSLDKLVLSHLEKLKLIKIQAWIHYT